MKKKIVMYTCNECKEKESVEINPNTPFARPRCSCNKYMKQTKE